MYVPNHFALSEQQVRELLLVAPRGQLITRNEHTDGAELDATLLPFVHRPGPGLGSLVTHMTRVNPQWQDVSGEALVIVQGPDGYIAPAWSSAAAASVVPTWNYLLAHAHGELLVHDDPTWVTESLAELATAHDPQWRLSDADASWVERMVRAVVGIEVRLTRVIGKAKLSQNKSSDDVASIIDGLRDAGNDALADLMGQLSIPAAERREALVADVRARHQS